MARQLSLHRKVGILVPFSLGQPKSGTEDGPRHLREAGLVDKLSVLVPGGLTLREIFYIAETISNTGRLSVLDVAEVNPSIGSEHSAQITVSNTVDVIASFFGRRRAGNYI